MTIQLVGAPPLMAKVRDGSFRLANVAPDLVSVSVNAERHIETIRQLEMIWDVDAG